MNNNNHICPESYMSIYTVNHNNNIYTIIMYVNVIFFISHNMTFNSKILKYSTDAKYLSWVQNYQKNGISKEIRTLNRRMRDLDRELK